MLMTILTPQERRQRRMRRLGLTGLTTAVVLVTVGAWAAAQAQGRYVLLVVDSHTGEVVSRTSSEDLALPATPPVDWKRLIDGLLRNAASGLAERLETFAEEGEEEPKETPVVAPPVLAGGPPQEMLRILVTDTWAAPGGVLVEP